MDEFLTIPEPSRKQLEEKAIAYYDKLHSVGQFVSIDHVAPAFIAGHASRDAEVAQLKALLERARSTLMKVTIYGPSPDDLPSNSACMACDMGDSGYSPDGPGHHDKTCPVMHANKWLADYERMEKGGRG